MTRARRVHAIDRREEIGAELARIIIDLGHGIPGEHPDNWDLAALRMRAALILDLTDQLEAERKAGMMPV